MESEVSGISLASAHLTLGVKDTLLNGVLRYGFWSWLQE